MTRAELLDFLRYCGAAVENAGDEQQPVVFNNRGMRVVAFPYDDGDLMHLMYEVEAPAAMPPADRALAILRDVEDALPVVKLRLGDDGKSLIVLAEQFEPGGPAAGNVFWRTVDLLVDAAGQCFERLATEAGAPKGERAAGVAADRSWLRQLEKALRAGASGKRDLATSEGENAVCDAVLAGVALLVDAGDGSGSAFCIESSPKRTLYVTCAHVVAGTSEVTLYAQRPKYRKFKATVIARAEGVDGDLALLAAPPSNLAAPLVLANSAPLARTRIAVAGYPRVQLFAAEQFGELVPAIRFGYVVGVLTKGGCVLHDATSRPGNSGGPVFDVATGAIVGVQQGGWAEEEESVAIGPSRLHAFLRKYEASK